MEKYRLVQEHKGVGMDVDEAGAFAMGEEAAAAAAAAASSSSSTRGSDGWPEVRITQQGKPRNYISYAMNLFADGSSTVVLKAMGRAINKAVTIAEILKRKMPLHQQNALFSVEMIDVYEPLEEGLDVVTSRRYVSCMKITLSLSGEGMDIHHPGYQPPLPESELHPGDYHPAGVGSSGGSVTTHQQPMVSAS